MASSEVTRSRRLLQSLQNRLAQLEDNYFLQARDELREMRELLVEINNVLMAPEETETEEEEAALFRNRLAEVADLVRELQERMEDVQDNYQTDEDIALHFAETEVNDAVARLQYYPELAGFYESLVDQLNQLQSDSSLLGRQYYTALQRINLAATEEEARIQDQARADFDQHQQRQNLERAERDRQQHERDQRFEENQRRLNGLGSKRPRRGSTS